MKKKTSALLLALVLLAGGIIGGTLAWLTDDTDPVVNTFTASNIDITLTETPNLDFKMIPGHHITKDPTVTVEEGSEDCWLFVKIDKSANFDTFMTYAMGNGWGALPPEYGEGILFRKITAEAGEIGTPLSVLHNDEVIVKDTVTKEMMDALTPETYPTLTFTAYATQLWKSHGVSFTEIEAWEILNPSP